MATLKKNEKISAADIAPRDREWLLYFLESCSAERGLATLSLSAYCDDIVQFLTYLKKNQLTAAEVVEATARDYLAHLARTNHIGGASGARKLSALRQFYNFLTQEKFITTNPLIDIDNPKIPRSLPKILSVADADRLLAAIGDLEKKEQTRLRAMVELLYAGGLRVSEMVALPLGAVDVEKKIVRVVGKGNKERLAIINNAAAEAVACYMAERPSFLAKDDGRIKNSPFLFPSGGGRGAASRSGHLTRQRFAQLLKDLARAAGLNEKRISPHVLRHAFACHLLAGGADLRSLQLLLGHSHIATTEIYTHLDMGQKKKLVLEKHPLAQRALGNHHG